MGLTCGRALTEYGGVTSALARSDDSRAGTGQRGGKAEELESLRTLALHRAQIDDGDAVGAVVDQLAYLQPQADLLPSIKVADEHGVLQGCAEILHRGVHGAQVSRFTDVVGDEVAVAGHSYLVAKAT